jgi:hypothetical protein
MLLFGWRLRDLTKVTTPGGNTNLTQRQWMVRPNHQAARVGLAGNLGAALLPGSATLEMLLVEYYMPTNDDFDGALSFASHKWKCWPMAISTDAAGGGSLASSGFTLADVTGAGIPTTGAAKQSVPATPICSIMALEAYTIAQALGASVPATIRIIVDLWTSFPAYITDIPGPLVGPDPAAGSNKDDAQPIWPGTSEFAGIARQAPMNPLIFGSLPY